MLKNANTMHLEMIYYFDRDYQFNPIELPNLKCLALDVYRPYIVKHFLGARSLIEISLKNCDDYYQLDETELSIIVQFLSQQMSLKKLNLFELAPFIFSRNLNVEFQLTTLHIELDEEHVRRFF